MIDLTGRTVLITGASRGIGAEAARVFAEAGANVALVARSADSIADLAGEIGNKAVAIPCDISRYWEVAQAVENCVPLISAKPSFGPNCSGARFN